MNKYLEFLHDELKVPQPEEDAPLVYDLFAGCGGLALGFEAVGFRTIGFEILRDACDTYSENLHGNCRCVYLEEGTDLGPKPDIIIGGPPCQPFSVGGFQNGRQDCRDGFPAFLSALQYYQPKVALFENVRGMMYKSKAYLEHIITTIRHMNYVVETKILDAVMYGVPQRRERLFVIAHRGVWKFPPLYPQSLHFTAGDAIADLENPLPEDTKFLTPSMDAYVARYEEKSKCIRPRDLKLDTPSRTVTCRNLCGATGDMLRIRLLDGRRRRLTIREGARLQSFPDWFEFYGSEASQFNQIGNAVPPLLAKALARSVADCYFGNTLSDKEIREFNSERQLSLV